MDLSVCFDEALNRIKKKNAKNETMPTIPKNPVKRLMLIYFAISLVVAKSRYKAKLKSLPTP